MTTGPLISWALVLDVQRVAPDVAPLAFWGEYSSLEAITPTELTDPVGKRPWRRDTAILRCRAAISAAGLGRLGLVTLGREKPQR